MKNYERADQFNGGQEKDMPARLEVNTYQEYPIIISKMQRGINFYIKNTNCTISRKNANRMTDIIAFNTAKKNTWLNIPNDRKIVFKMAIDKDNKIYFQMCQTQVSVIDTNQLLDVLTDILKYEDIDT